ncbi:MAG: hypothetical protein EXS13_15300, partial [Planctomycetes bacterium]|nr:hypothetical protein [Planctomycetota bacterium]
FKILGIDTEAFTQADAYSGHDILFGPGSKRTEVGCWAHARRYFKSALDSEKEFATEAMATIRRLYAIERAAKEQNLAPSEWNVRRSRERADRGASHRVIDDRDPVGQSRRRRRAMDAGMGGRRLRRALRPGGRTIQRSSDEPGALLGARAGEWRHRSRLDLRGRAVHGRLAGGSDLSRPPWQYLLPEATLGRCYCAATLMGAPSSLPSFAGSLPSYFLNQSRQCCAT